MALYVAGAQRRHTRPEGFSLSSSLQSSFGSAQPSDCDSSRRPGGSLGRSMELELIPRLLAHARDVPAQQDWPAPTRVVISDTDVTRFVQACLSHDEERCPGIITGLIEAGAPLERLCLDLLAPSARILGEMWDDDEVDFVEVTLGLGRMQRVVRDLGRRVAAETPMAEDAGQAFLCGMPDEQHSLGLAMVAEFFVADGWGVTVGPPLGAEDVLHEVGAHWYDVVGLSAALGERIPRIAAVIRDIRAASLNADLAVMVGGRAFVDHPEMVAQVGADASASDAAQGPLVARTLVQARRASRPASVSPSPSPNP